MKCFRVGVVGATGMVGQRFVSLLDGHPWFRLAAVAASPKSAGKLYGEAVKGRWVMARPIPQEAAGMTVLDAVADRRKMAGLVDFIFCAVDLDKASTRELEEDYARLECPVISNNSACRALPDVPMVIPEVNPGHLAVIPSQRRRLRTRRGFIAVKSNCSIQSYVPALHPLWEFGINRALACTCQAVSGAGKTLEGWPQMADNVIPFIPGEEEKSEREPLKIWGNLLHGEILPLPSPFHHHPVPAGSGERRPSGSGVCLL